LFECSDEKRESRPAVPELLKSGHSDESADSSVFPVESLNSLLSSKSVTVRNRDVLLQLMLKLDSTHRDLLQHIQIGFLSDDRLSLSDQHFRILYESIWECGAERITQPTSLLDSRIISNVPEILEGFQGKRFRGEMVEVKKEKRLESPM
jgi:hypothetical protein